MPVPLLGVGNGTSHLSWSLERAAGALVERRQVNRTEENFLALTTPPPIVLGARSTDGVNWGIMFPVILGVGVTVSHGRCQIYGVKQGRRRLQTSETCLFACSG